jgi:CelD/BcsL family acetyltransferase involved in cellulose biosynthesis
LRIHVARSASELDRLRGVWEFLHVQTPSATLFQSFAWNRLAAITFATRESPFVVLAESDSGVSLLPAAITSHGVGFIGEGLFDYRDFLSVGSADACEAAWTCLSQLQLPIRVRALRGEAVRERWSSFNPASFVRAPQVLSREISGDDFGSTHSRMERSLRRLTEQGAELRQYNGSAAKLLAFVYGQKGIDFGDGQDSIFADPLRIAFMIAACGLDPAACEVFTWEARGAPIATLVTFRDGDFRRCYTTWFDRNWARYSPGSVLLYAVTRRSLLAGIDCDYMTGEQPYKLRFATSAEPLFRVEIPAGTTSLAA